MNIGSWFSGAPVPEEKSFITNHFATIATTLVFGIGAAFWCCRRTKHHHRTSSNGAGKTHTAAHPALHRAQTTPIIPVGKPGPAIPPKPKPKGSAVAAVGVKQIVRRSENMHNEALAGAPTHHTRTSPGIIHPPVRAE